MEINNTKLNSNKPIDKKVFGKKFFIVVTVILLMFVSFVSGVVVNNDSDLLNFSPRIVGGKQVPDYLNKKVNFNLYWKVIDIIKDRYFDKDKVLDTQLFYGSLKGLVASLGDPYSVFLDPVVTEEFTQELSGNFQGIGAEIGIKKGVLTIIAPLPDTPAERAGLTSGDKVLAIDSVSTAGMSLDEAVNRIRGEKGTEVVLKILSKGDEEPRDVKIVRDDIKIISVSWKEKENKIAYIRLSYFNEDTAAQFRKVAQEVLAFNPKAIILDLRNNPGGFLNVSVDIASYWIEGGKPVVFEKFSNGEKDEYRSVGYVYFKDIPTVVLVNEGSASASEILAGALQDYGKAVLIGETTFGKGSVQDLIDLEDGSSVKITIAKWLTPKERMIDIQGIDPDVQVELTIDDYNNDLDPQLDEALRYIKEDLLK